MKRVVLAIFFFTTALSTYAQGQIPFDEETTLQIAIQVVLITVQPESGNAERGSGVIVSPTGVIFTANHVIENASSDISIQLFDPNTKGLGTIYYASIIFSSEEIDFAILQISFDASKEIIDPNQLDLPFIEHWATNVALNSEIELFSYPLIAGTNLTTTPGVITTIEQQQIGLPPIEVEFYLTNAVFAGGGSGGLAVNQTGAFIGIPFQTSPAVEGDAETQLVRILPISTICIVENTACQYDPSNNHISSTPPANNSNFVPSFESFSSGETFSIEGNEGWICSGDAELTSPRLEILYDFGPNSGQTGLIVVTPPHSLDLSLYMPYGATCASYQDGSLEVVLPIYIDNMLNGAGCDNAGGNPNCDSLQVILLSTTGQVMERRVYSDPYVP